jgi:hypothetical protein
MLLLVTTAAVGSLFMRLVVVVQAIRECLGSCGSCG